MKIGIITYWNSDDNYGQQLQCYALQTYLHLLGHNAFLIRYAPSPEKLSFITKIFRKLSIRTLKNFFSYSHRQIKRQEIYLKGINSKLNKQRGFEEFRNKYLQVSTEIYYSIEELRICPPQADIYICGSDQIWNNSLMESNSAAWFLDFGAKEVKRISYAASIGRTFTVKELNVFRRFLFAFDAISVREQSSKKLCQQMGFEDVTVTLDPTLLLSMSQYESLIAKEEKDKKHDYLFMYVLNVATQAEIYWDVIQQYLKKKTLDFHIVCSSGYMQARELIKEYKNEQVTISQWLSYIKNAQCVITTSFHGVVFCIKMHTPFLAILLTNRYANGNTRIISLLHSVGLENRIYNSANDILEQMNCPIDWIQVDIKLKELQHISFDFIKKNI